VVLGGGANPEIDCSLPAEALPGRAVEWHAIAGHVQWREPLREGAGVRPVLDDRVSMEQLAKLAVTEHGCCAFLGFAITVDDRGIALEVRAPEESAEILTAMFGAGA
jgi:hypothetical protein